MISQTIHRDIGILGVRRHMLMFNSRSIPLDRQTVRKELIPQDLIVAFHTAASDHFFHATNGPGGGTEPCHATAYDKSLRVKDVGRVFCFEGMVDVEFGQFQFVQVVVGGKYVIHVSQ